MTLLPYILTSFFFTLIYSIFPGSECEHTNRLFISIQFRSFLLSGKTGKRFIWNSPKVHRFWNWNYPPSWLNILVFKYVNISVGLPLLSIGAIRKRSSKIRYCIIWRCLHLMFTAINVSEKWNKQVFLVLERYIGFEPRFEIINAVTSYNLDNLHRQTLLDRTTSLQHWLKAQLTEEFASDILVCVTVL